MTILVDSNVLLDVMTEDPAWYGWSSNALVHAAETERLTINAVIYAEISIRFSRIEELEDALPRSFLDRQPIPHEAAFLAGKVYQTYRKRGGNRTAPLPDFFIGAHAAVAEYGLLTRDPQPYLAYFRNLRMIAPQQD
jgi:predicted nucleic acid-binding protein